MKLILLFTGIITLLFGTTGCLVTEGGGHGRGHGHSSVFVPVVVEPAVEVR
jgi:hypothetical protein